MMFAAQTGDRLGLALDRPARARDGVYRYLWPRWPGAALRQQRKTTGRALTMASAVTVAYTYLGIAIVAEVVATSALKASEGFTRPMPSLITAVGYALAFLLPVAHAQKHSHWRGLRPVVGRGHCADFSGGLAVAGPAAGCPGAAGLGPDHCRGGGDQCVFQKHHTLNKSCTRFYL